MSRSIVISPISNDPLRDWPMRHYRDLARLCVERLEATVDFIGLRAQRLAVTLAINDLPSDRFRNLCGATSWAETGALLKAADCVIANNSGVAHLAAKLEVPTVCIFGASHNPFEWMARGPNVSILFKRTGCSPCAIGVLSLCPYDKRCLTEILPEDAFAVVRRTMDRANAAATAT